MGLILHIAPRNDWKSFSSNGYYIPHSLKSDGFIHCSTVEQTVKTANDYYNRQKDLVLLCINEKLVESTVKYEEPACVGDQRTESLFPHIYGPLNISSVISVVDFDSGTNGQFDLPMEVNRLAKITI